MSEIPRLRLSPCYNATRHNKYVRRFTLGPEIGLIALKYHDTAPFDGIFYLEAETLRDGRELTLSVVVSGNPRDLLDVMWDTAEAHWMLNKAYEEPEM